jgi:uncharacterized membrane protein YgcG
MVLGAAAPANADSSDFSFSSFDATYDLSRDSSGHSQLRTEETLVAEFPDFDQNHGIERLLVDRYDGHPTDIDIESIRDGAGNELDYGTDSDGDYLVLRIGDEDEYVHGEQTYVITYTQQNVTAYFADTDDDEFYWDTNGTGWRQPFGSVTATVTIADDLLPALTGDVSGVYGAQGAANAADITEDATSYTFTANNLAAGENLTMIVGFEAGTFTERDSGFFAAPWPTLALITLLIGVIALILAIRLRSTALRSDPGRGIIVAEYVAPKGVSLLMSSVILGKKTKATPAQIIALAVAGHLRVVEVGKKRKPSYRLDFVTADGADADSLEFLHALFGPTFEVGESHSLAKNDAKAAKKITRLMTRVTADATTAGYRKKLPTGRLALAWLLIVGSAALTFIFSIIALTNDYGGGVPTIFLAATIALTIISGALLIATPLSKSGVELRDYLRGLKVYIDLAEEDRLRYLQSPQGAERTPVSTTDPAQVVKLNEKLLPYAVLFGNEKQWAKELGRFYEQNNSQPDWYYGTGAFNAAYFASSIGSVSSTASTSLSSASSSSGGTGGGGFSGGGGGGGGGGGW